MRFNLSLLRILSFSLLSAFSVLVAHGQSDRGAITGTVLDSSGGVVEGASITATGVETGTVYTTTSTSTGAYRFSNLVLGHYDLAVTAKGFKVSTLTGVEVRVNSTSSLDINLQPGDVKETVTVPADAPTVHSTTSDIATVVAATQILELPSSR